MEKRIEDYLAFYLGQRCLVDGKRVGECWSVSKTRVEFNGGKWNVRFDEHLIQPLLRQLSSMTEEEYRELGKVIISMHDGDTHYSAQQFTYLLSKGIDIFGLIDAQLAIDNSTIKG